MKIILCHNFYRQRGGEDRVFVDEEQLLIEKGHDVIRFTRHNKNIEGEGNLDVAVKTIWNRKTAAELGRLVLREHAEIVHFHNIVPLISPAAYYAVRKAGAAVVQSLHNYRMVCPKGTFFRDNRICEDCSGKLFAWPAIRYACYHESRAGSAVLSTMLATHRVLKTYANAVDVFIAMSIFSLQKLVHAGLPETKVELKPNFVSPDPGPGIGQGGYAMYLGRLSPEKGIDTLLNAWSRVGRTIRLKLVGNGPLAGRVKVAAQINPNVEWLPAQNDNQVRDIMANAAFLVLPFVNYEGFPKTIVEAFSLGTPVITSKLGAMSELIDHRRTGMHFEAGNVDDLVNVVNALAIDRDGLLAMRAAARAEYISKYTAERNYSMLAKIYKIAIDRARNSYSFRMTTEP